MKEIKIDFLENFKKNRIDEKYLESKEKKLGVRFGRKYKEFLIECRIPDNSKIYASKYIPSKLITSLSFSAPHRDNQNFIDTINMILSGSISLKSNSTEINYYISIGLEGSEIEDKIYIVNQASQPEYICQDINQFVDSIHDKNGNRLKFINENYSSYKLNEEDILEAEQEIGLKFPDNYKKFLLTTGGGTLYEPSVIDNKTNNKINYIDFKDPNRPIFYNKYAPSDKMNSEDYIRLNFCLGDTLNYWNILKGENDIDYNFQAICEKHIIPIGLNGDTGVFFIGAKDFENEGKILFYDYVLSDNGGYVPEAIEFICDSFEEYNNSFYWKIADNIDYSLKSNIKYF